MLRVLLAVLLITTTAYAADVVPFKNGMVFNHKAHQTERVGKCFVCHENVTVSQDGAVVTTKPPGKIKGFGREWAHKYCTDCHDLFGEGPTSCDDCHQQQ